MKILVFAPHAGIWVHSFPEALVVEALKQHGQDIVYVTCGGVLRNFCIAMSAVGLTSAADASQKSRVCADCKSAKTTIRNRFGFAGYDLDEKLESRDFQRVQEIVDTVTQDNLLDVVIEGIDVGRFALYEFLLNRKKGNLVFSAEEWEEYRIALRNALYGFFSVKRILDEEKPERIVVYNSLYSVNRVACRMAELRSIPSYFLHAGGNLSRRLETLLIGRKDGFKFYDDLLDYWPRVKQLPCPEQLLEPVTDHFLELLRGRSAFVYSAPRFGNSSELRGKFRVPAGARVMVVTMSSPDERFAAETVGIPKRAANPIFPSQIEWIRALVEFVKPRPDLHLIIRVHPREFPNKREGVKSGHAVTLEHELSALPGNAIVNWPGDGVSLYDLAEIADVFLNAWSAAGKEMALLGIPVVTYSGDLIAYPRDLNYCAATKGEYFAMVEKALADGWSIEHSRLVYRWGVLEFEKAIIDLRESFPASTTKGKTRRFVDRVLRRLSFTLARNADCIRRVGKLKAAGLINDVVAGGHATLLEVDGLPAYAVGVDQETTALRNQIGRLVKAMYGSEELKTSGEDLRARLSRFAAG
jgi:hypothetical protein